MAAYFKVSKVFFSFLPFYLFFTLSPVLRYLSKNFKLLNMLVYSRNTLISLRNWHKTLKLSTELHGSTSRPVSEEVWQRLAFYNLLAPTRGRRGGSHLKDHRPIRTVQLLNRRKKYSIQNGPNLSNLLNIQARTDEIKSVTTTTNKREKSNFGSKLRVAHLNARSLKNRSHILQMRELVREKDYDVLAISESWLNSTVTNAEIEIEGYRLTRLDRLHKAGGGVCVYTKVALKVKRLKEISGISESGFHQLWIQVQLNRLKSFVLCVTYRPDYCPVSCFVNNFMDNYSQALTLGKPLVITGDLNCNLLEPQCSEAIALLDFCKSVNLTQLIKEPTRVTETSSTLLDVIITSNTNLVDSSGVLPCHISDHYLVHATLKLKNPKPPPRFVRMRSFKYYDGQQFAADLEQIPWDEVASAEDASEMLDRFNNKFIDVLDAHAPVKTIRIKHRCCPFVDAEIRDLMRNRNILLKRARQTRMLVDWEEYRLSRDRVKSELRNAEKEFVKRKLESSKDTSSKWKVIRNCIPRRESSQPVYARDLKEVASEFNKFFTSVGAKASKDSQSLIDLHDLPPPLPRAPLFIPDEDKFRFQAVSTRDVQRVVMSFPSDKAPGYDKIPMSVIKDALPCILPILTLIVNRSLLSSVFPIAWKTSEVVPLPKDGDHEMANNNRPVSLLPAASKICERIALNQLTSYMNKNNRLTEHQSGNKAMHSCETLNVFMTDKVLEAMDSKQLMLMVLLDLSKAFDSLEHDTLLAKLHSLGLSHSALEWFRSYLSERSQYVRIGSEVSGLESITFGVPQGSILGPALFNIYLNDLPTIPHFGSLESYVDDSKLYLSFPVKDVNTIVQQINEDLSLIASWCCHNHLLINPDKTKLLIMGTRQMLQKLPNCHITILGKEIAPSTSARDLGVQVDATLSYDEHITNITSTCMASLCQINRIKHLLDSRTLENVITSLVFSKLYFCSTVWANTSKTNVQKLQKIQNFAARIVTGTRKYDHITPVLNDLRWLSVSAMLAFYDAILTFKCLKGIAPKYLSSRFKTRAHVHGKNTRNKKKLDIPAFSTAAGQRSFIYRAVKCWNTLPEEITECTSLHSFKAKAKSHFHTVFK